MIDLDTNIRLMEAQLGDPRSSNGKTNKEYKIWRSNVLKAMAYKKRDYKLIKMWLKTEKSRLRAKLLSDDGIESPKDPLAMLAQLHQATLRIIKINDLEFNISDSQWRIIDQAREIALGE